MSERPMRTLVVDDEPLARRYMRELLASRRDVEVVGEAPSGRAALQRVGEQPVDLLLLDVEMPGLSGIEVVERLLAGGDAAAPVPVIVFVTAFDHYAVSAFELHALDYLLKPVDEERLGRALARARAALRHRDDGAQSQRMLALLEDMHRRNRFAERLPVKVGERIYLQPVEAIDWIEANGKYVNIHVGKECHTVRDTLAQVAEELDPARFVRISRSAIVNVAKIREIQPWFRGEYVVLLQSGREIPSTRAFRHNLTSLLERRR